MMKIKKKCPAAEAGQSKQAFSTAFRDGDLRGHSEDVKWTAADLPLLFEIDSQFSTPLTRHYLKECQEQLCRSDGLEPPVSP